MRTSRDLNTVETSLTVDGIETVLNPIAVQCKQSGQSKVTKLDQSFPRTTCASASASADRDTYVADEIDAIFQETVACITF